MNLTRSRLRPPGSAGAGLSAYALPACAGMGFVFSSPLLRGLLTSMLWLARPPHPVRVFADMDSATRWGVQVARAAARARQSQEPRDV